MGFSEASRHEWGGENCSEGLVETTKTHLYSNISLPTIQRENELYPDVALICFGFDFIVLTVLSF